MNLDDLTLGEIKQLKALLSSGKSCNTPTSHGVKIVIIDRGFIYIGNVTTNAEFCEITNCKNIRRWGTTKGLGQLTDGPLKDTILDACGDLKIPIHAVISIMAVVEEKWTKSL